MEKELNPRKIGIIGCGFVGAATAYTLMQTRLFSEMVLIDNNMERLKGKLKTSHMGFSSQVHRRYMQVVTMI